MKINKLYDDVYEINNFLTEDQLNEVYKIINNTPEEDWFDEKSNKQQKTSDFWYGKNLYFNKPTIFDNINYKMKSLLESYSFYPEQMHLQRYKKGDFINYHADAWATKNSPSYIGYGFCLYYNDDYEGGELDYKELEIVVKPKANSLYIHGGHIMHGSLPVLDDKIRYFSTVFVKGDQYSPTKLREDLFQ